MSNQNYDPEFGASLGPTNIPCATKEGHIPVWSHLDSSGEIRHHFHRYPINLHGIQGAILDLDGFLVNSERPIVRCIMLGARELLREKLEDKNAALPQSIVKRITNEALGNADTKMSLIVRTILRESDSLPGRLSQLDDKGFIEEFQRIRQTYFEELIENGEFNEMTGASDFIKELSRNLEGRVAIFTGSQEQNADLEITALGLDDYLPKQYRVYASDLGPGQGKPNPAGFHRAQAKLGLKVGDPWISGGDRWKDAVGALAAEGCVEFIAVAENLDRFKFQEPFGKLTNNDTSVLDGMNLDQNALDQLSIGVDKLPLRLVFVESLHKSCVEFVQIAPGEWPPRVNSLELLRLPNLGR